MNPFERLRDGEGTETERWLLDSASEDLPSNAARERTLAALGVAGTLSVSSGTALAATKAASAGSAGAFKAAGVAGSVSVLKWLGIGAAVGALTAAGVATITTPGLVFSLKGDEQAATTRVVARAPVAQTATHAGSVASKEAVPAEVEPAAVVPPADVSAQPLVERSPRTAADPVAPVVPTPSAEPIANASRVALEVASLDRARAALSEGEPRAALARLSEHERSFPDGTLEPEAVLLRVRAWLELGQPEQAKAVADGFLSRHPRSAQATRLRALVGE